MMPFEGIKKLFPNLNLQTVGNELKIEIPVDDIITGLKNKLREDLRPYTTIKAFPDGIVMEVDVSVTLLAKLKKASPNARINPTKVEVFIPKEDILRSFKASNPNISVEYSEKGVVVSAKLM